MDRSGVAPDDAKTMSRRPKMGPQGKALLNPQNQWKDCSHVISGLGLWIALNSIE